MKRAIWTVAAILTAVPAWSAPRDPKEDVKAAAAKLGEAANYSWVSTPKSDAPAGGGGQGRRGQSGPTEGKTEKGGVTHLVVKFGEMSVEAALKGEKMAMKSQDGWKAVEASAEGAGGKGGQRDPSAFFARSLRNFKAPAAQAVELADKAKELKTEGDAIVGEMTEEGAKSLASFGGRGGGGQGPQIAGAKGTVKYWLKDGVLVKYEYNVQGKMTIQDREIDINRTTTVEIKDVGSTKIELPEEAKSKLG
jgi:hypothetical protein